MILRYDGQENIQASKDSVWSFISDPQKIGYCLPNVNSIEVKDPNSFIANINVGIGPVRGKFKVDVNLSPQPAQNKMLLKLHGGGLGTAVDLEADADINEQNGQTHLVWNSEALVKGPAATVGTRILDRKAREVITYVFSEVKRQVNAEQN